MIEHFKSKTPKIIDGFLFIMPF